MCAGRTTLKWRRSSVAISPSCRRSAKATIEASVVPRCMSAYCRSHGRGEEEPALREAQLGKQIRARPIVSLSRERRRDDRPRVEQNHDQSSPKPSASNSSTRCALSVREGASDALLELASALGISP